jgi:hypothetical protein
MESLVTATVIYDLKGTMKFLYYYIFSDLGNKSHIQAHHQKIEKMKKTKFFLRIVLGLSKKVNFSYLLIFSFSTLFILYYVEFLSLGYMGI